MADWNDIKNDLKKTVSGVGKEITKLGNIGATKLKLNGLKVELAELFEELGRISYKKLRENQNEMVSTEEIAKVITKIDEKRRLISQLEEELEESKKENE
ncbi:MAG: hypothetical protein E7601_05515 [Ruminococcaceae bacterium]|nr:hypothetical protein [Oscillospiraceae bacterium]MBQ1259945.1 hypothetical protein [Clostridia bacterium]